MDLNHLTAISPVDGRYRAKTSSLSPYFSEFGLIRYRVMVEARYLVALSRLSLPQLEGMDEQTLAPIIEVANNLSVDQAQAIKDIEKETNHDVKAVEYFLKQEMEKVGLGKFGEFVHFGLTSQDINNTALPMSVRDALADVYLPLLSDARNLLDELAAKWLTVPMLARTHGQPASPTTIGKEFKVFVERIDDQIALLAGIPQTAKFGGATGNFNAHHVAYPAVDWPAFGNAFLKDDLGLVRSQYTTQIDHYDNLAAQFDAIKRINTILIDLCQDVWTYISRDYFKQELKKGEVGSSTMPHKVNPIDFENAEGNFGFANAQLQHLSAKLPVSRLQRDLTDSTVTRNVGVPFAHGMIGLNSLLKGLNKLILNEDALASDLENNWAVVAEAIQTILRREGIEKPYEKLKDLTRNNETIGAESIKAFVEGLDVSNSVKEELLAISPSNYTGIIS